MARINLLPWREAERHQRRQEFAVAGGIALGIVLLSALGVHFWMEGRIGIQEERNKFLDEQIGQLNRQIKEIQVLEETKAKLLARMNIIQQLQQSRPEVVRLFDQLVTAIPEGVFLVKLDQTGRNIVLEGRAQSNARVSAFMRNVEGSAWLGNPHLLLIENKDKTGTGFSHFRMSFDQIRPTADANAQPPS
ncbi:PilN domain-containing protein [uncultured Thiodictyon sp.]|uniref:PilN domain-containing protein n=1 Tax=uncultured Thiodictyon sp. TaxID=1846217 RepID=UPI0025E7DEB4|nr:PilN domain-containing protein [uncultured Thiodictyon sp.]